MREVMNEAALLMNRRNFLSALLALPVVAKLLPESLTASVESTLTSPGYEIISTPPPAAIEVAQWAWVQIPGSVSLDLGMGPHNTPKIVKQLNRGIYQLQETMRKQEREEYNNVEI